MADKHIVLFCVGGMSTGILINKMKAEAQKLGKDYEITACAIAEQDTKGPLADVILVGPQVKYAVGKLKEQFPDKPVVAIDTRTYGMMKGDEVLRTAMKLMGEE
ncbi:MAG: PTS sugar transporter subunit IIB [Solobacterium sp.]|nr:PTS sugar transporter subunit IIB [Solobacterium sp.]